MRVQSRILWSLRLVTASFSIFRLKKFLSYQYQDYLLEPLHQGKGYSLKFLVYKDAIPVSFVKIETILDRLLRSDTVDRKRQRIQKEAADMQVLFAHGLAPEVITFNSRFYVTKYVSGPRLREYVNQHIKTSEANVICMLRLVLEAIIEIHDLGLYHDGNPDNILIENGNPLFIDTEITVVTNSFPSFIRLFNMLELDNKTFYSVVEEAIPGIHDMIPHKKSDVRRFKEWLLK